MTLLRWTWIEKSLITKFGTDHDNCVSKRQPRAFHTLYTIIILTLIYAIKNSSANFLLSFQKKIPKHHLSHLSMCTRKITTITNMFGEHEQYPTVLYRQIGFCFKIALHCMVYMMFEFWINFIGHPGIIVNGSLCIYVYMFLQPTYIIMICRYWLLFIVLNNTYITRNLIYWTIFGVGG